MASFSTILSTIQAIAGAFPSSDSGNAPVLMMLGGFKFSLNTLVFQEVDRATEYTWGEQQRFGQLDALQYTGPGSDTLELPGVLYPDFRGSVDQLDALRSLAAAGNPLRLMDSTGNVLGMWVILRVEDRRMYHTPAGDPRRVDFTVSLRKYGDGADL